METGLMVRSGRFVPEHEEQANTFLQENGRFWREQLARAVITSYEPYFFQTGDREQERRFFIARSPSDTPAAAAGGGVPDARGEGLGARRRRQGRPGRSEMRSASSWSDPRRSARV